MTFEQMVQGALHVADDFQPSPDLFAKVQRSIEEDLAHRKRVRRVLGWVLGSIVAVVVYVAVTVDVVDGTVEMAFGALELLVTAVMVALVLVLGPAIRRFGETYQREVFRSSPETGERVLRLLDVAYYLIFFAYILMTLQFEASPGFGLDLVEWVRNEFVRVGGLLMLMGVLHVVLLIALPISGLVFGSNERRHRIAAGAPATDLALDRVDKVITIVAWIAAGLAVLQLIGLVLNLVLVFGASG